MKLSCKTDGCTAPVHAKGLCMRHYARLRRTDPEVRARQLAINQRRVDEVTAYLAALRASTPCIDCGGPARDFHRRDSTTKSFDVSCGIRHRTLAMVRAEVAKCDLLCHACHVARQRLPGSAQSQDAIRSRMPGACVARTTPAGGGRQDDDQETDRHSPGLPNERSRRRLVRLTRAVQRERIEEICGHKGLVLVDVHEELDVSVSKPLDKRPGLLQAVTAVEEGRADVVGAAYFDRLFRSLRTQAEVVEREAQARVDQLGGPGAALTVSVARDWDRLTREEHRALIQAVVERVTVAPGGIGAARLSIQLVSA